MSEELKPCPFCGDGMPAIHRIKAQFNLACVYCLCAGPLACSVEEAVGAWNRRAGEAQIDALKAALEPFADAYDLNSTDGPCLTKADVAAMHNWVDVQSFRRASQALASSKMKQGTSQQ